MVRVLVTAKHWDTHEYAYGKYKRVGTPSIAMHTLEFPNKEEAEKAIRNLTDFTTHAQTEAKII